MRAMITRFNGYNHTPGASEGEIYDMKNMSTDAYPLLQTRKRRQTEALTEEAQDIYAAYGRLYTICGTWFCENGVKKGTVLPGRKQFAAINQKVVIFPDRKLYDPYTGVWESMEAEWSGIGTIRDGTFAGQPAKLNTIYARNANFDNLFKPGDAVTVAVWETTETTIIVREVEGEELRFYDNSFLNFYDDMESMRMRIARYVPNVNFVFQHDNRLWGCIGDTIFASKLGDPKNWNVYDGISTDSYAVQTGSGGEFTGAISYGGYPIFFKEDRIYKLYGDKPSNYQLMQSASIGVQEGSDRSLAIANETLFYLSRVGVMAYKGGIPQNISAAFGEDKYKNGVAGSDGEKYYISMEGTEQGLFVFDPLKGLWAKEDNLQVVAWAWHGKLLALADNLYQIAYMDGTGMVEPPMESMVEFGDFYESTTQKKSPNRIQIRAELEEGTRLQVKIQYDSNGVWITVCETGKAKKQVFDIPFIPHRCDHYRLRLEAKGDWKLHAITRQSI